MKVIMSNGDAACRKESVSRTGHWAVEFMSLRDVTNSTPNINAALLLARDPNWALILAK